MVSEKAPDAPGTIRVIHHTSSDPDLNTAPGTSIAAARPGSRNSKPPAVTGKHAGDDRYAVLLKRIDDLERIHAGDKKNVRRPRGAPVRA